LGKKKNAIEKKVQSGGGKCSSGEFEGEKIFLNAEKRGRGVSKPLRI